MPIDTPDQPADMPRQSLISPNTSRYEMFANTLVSDIESGKYAVGSLLPPESELCRQYGLSRHTIREGVRKLVEMGLVSRHQGIGTKVISDEVKPQYFAALTSLDAVFSYVKESYLKILEENRITADEELALLLDCKPGQDFLQVKTCRYKISNKEPSSYVMLYIPLAFEGIRPYLAMLDHPVYKLLEKHYGQKIRDLQQEISVVSIPADIARLLDCPADSPGMHIIRRYRGVNGVLLATSVSTYPQSRFQVSIRYRLNWAGGLA